MPVDIWLEDKLRKTIAFEKGCLGRYFIRGFLVVSLFLLPDWPNFAVYSWWTSEVDIPPTITYYPSFTLWLSETVTVDIYVIQGLKRWRSVLI